MKYVLAECKIRMVLGCVKHVLAECKIRTVLGCVKYVLGECKIHTVLGSVKFVLGECDIQSWESHAGTEKEAKLLGSVIYTLLQSV